MIKFNLIKNWTGKKTIFLWFGFILLISFFLYPSSTFAGWVEGFISVITYLPYLLIGALFIFYIKVSQAFSWLMGGILDIVISPSFLSLSYTDPKRNQVISLGLTITQSFVNLLLVMALVYTALSLALRMNEIEAKKMLVRLIIVALLVNFAPVLCGLVVDGTNIAMYYFLKPIEKGVSAALTQVGAYIDVLIATLGKVFTGLSERLGVLMMGVTQIMVNISMGMAFLCYAGIFLLRYVAIWTLVILAPVAFAGWVFPKEKPPEAWEFLDWILLPLRMFRRLWDLWLEQFIQWSIIGIPMAFFLYLAMATFSLIATEFRQKMTMPGIEEYAVGFFGNVFPFFVIIVFLFLGFGLGLQTGAMGAERITAGFRAAHKIAQIKALQGIARTSGRLLAAPIRAPIREIGIIRRVYQAERAGGLPRRRALGRAIGGYIWRLPGRMGRRIRTGIVGEAREAREIGEILSKSIFGTRKGMVGAIRDVAEALGLPKKEKKERATCTRCGNFVPEGAAHCPHCGLRMPTCPQGHLTTPGAAFCHRCGSKIP